MCYTNVVFNQNITRNMNRDEVEHQRINDRVGFQSRFQTAGNLIFKPEPQSSLFVEQRQRFNKNHGPNDQIKRENDRDKADRFYEARLNKRLEREETRWRQEDSRDKRSEDIRVLHQKVQLDNKKNTNALGYNPITLAYQESNRGEKLRKYDEKKEVNRHVRSKNMVEKNNQGFNIITGQEKHVQNFTVPEKLRPLVEQRYAEKKDREALKYEPIRDKYDYLDD